MMSGNKELTKRVLPRTVIEGCDECPYLRAEYDDCGPDNYVCDNDDSSGYEVISLWYWKEKKEKRIPFPDWCPLEKISG